MPRWTSILGAMLLVLMLWTGSSAHAAEQFQCDATTSQQLLHVDGNDHAPRGESGDKDAVHHHTGCSAHCLATAAVNGNLASPHLALSQPVDRQQGWSSGDGPALTLRPPIA